MSASILAIGSAIPPRQLEQSAAANYALQQCCNTERHRRLLTTIYRRSGVSTRHTVITAESTEMLFPREDPAVGVGPTTAQRMKDYSEHAGPLAAKACGNALKRALTPATEITHLVTVSCTGFRAPGVDLAIIARLGLNLTVARTSIGFMGCHGALNGLRVARAFVEADPTAIVLLCCVELCSLHFSHGWHPQRVVANALFSDGAAAAVIAADDSSSAARTWEVLDQSSCVLPDSENEMTWSIGDQGFEMALSGRVPQLIEASLHSFLFSWLSRQSLGITDISTWAVHPGGPRILNAVEAALSLPAEALAVSREILRSFGNVSSVTSLLILDQLSSQAAGGPAVMLAFGPGLTIEAALLR